MRHKLHTVVNSPRVIIIILFAFFLGAAAPTLVQGAADNHNYFLCWRKYERKLCSAHVGETAAIETGWEMVLGCNESASAAACKLHLVSRRLSRRGRKIE